jgi:Domain of unknown function (DUF4157)
MSATPKTTVAPEAASQGKSFRSTGTNTKLVQKKAATPAPAPDPYEREAEIISQRVTADGAIARGTITPSAANLGEPVSGSVEQELKKPGTPLTPEVRQDMETRFGHDFSRVRIHAGPTAADSARDIHANAYTHGSHIVFGQGRFAPGTPDGKRLMAHELTHVIQQSAVQRPVVAREPTEDPDKNVSLGRLDSDIAGKAASTILGPTEWAVLKEFLRGLKGGLEAMPADQRERITNKFTNEGFIDSAKYSAGLAWGIITGIGKSIKGLFEAVITLVEIPYKIDQFLISTVPELAVKYGPRLRQLLADRDGIQDRIKKVMTKFLDNPTKSLDMIKGFMDAVGQLALSKVRSLGHSAAQKTLAFLEEPWYEYGKDIGSVVGQILFEVILAVASDAIANVIKEALLTVGRLGARAITGAVEIFRTLGRYVGEVIEWLSRAAGKAAGELGEAFEGVRTLLTKLRTLLAEMADEGALADTGVGGIKVKVPDVGPNVLESRAIKPPGSPTVADLRTPKIHPSNLPKEPPVPKGGLAGEAESAATKPHTPENPVSKADYKPGSSAAKKTADASDTFHSFPDIVKNYAGDATKFPIKGGDGVARELYQLEGSLKGVEGRFEWIMENGQITHQQFIPGGTINGIPIRK